MIEPRTYPRESGETDLAIRYLYTFRRIVVVAALVGAGFAWSAQWPGLFAASVCVGIGELIECSYYLGVLGWAQRRGSVSAGPATATVSAS